MIAEIFSNPVVDFAAAMAAHGLVPDEIIPDGKRHRFDCDGEKRGKKSGWYILYSDGIPAGAFGSWKSGISEKWCSKSDQTMTLAERREFRARIESAKQQAESAKLTLEAEAANASALVLSGAIDARDDNPYCIRKGITPFGVKEFSNERTLVIPIRDVSGILTSLQFICSDGVKRFKSHGRISGCFFSIGWPIDGVLLICEGFATGASLHQATGYAVAVAFNAGNLEAVAKALRAKFPEIAIIVCADNDRFTSVGNVGVISATKAAQAVSGNLAVPLFDSDEGLPTDFNDLHQIKGANAVKVIVDAALIPTSHTISSVIGDEQNGWPEPVPLIRAAQAIPYPFDALPGVVRSAVEEVQGFTKAPLAMVACSALATLSLAAQSHYDVQRAAKLSGPIGLYFLVIAESGERKSTCDGMFSNVLREYENQRREDAKTELKLYAADRAAWDASKSGLLDAIKHAAKGGKDAGELEHELRKHEGNKPEPPRVPRVIYSDFTPEALTFSLANNWPSGGVISSEAGTVFGSHGMGKESQLRTLATLNQLWDGAKLTFDRRVDSYVVDGARLTMSLQVQESTLLDFFNRTGALARGTGFLARFLIAHPESTQGTRMFTEPPLNMPALANFQSRILRLLEIPAPINDRGGLDPVMLTLSPDAKAAWVDFHDQIEAELGKGGELQDVRDVASKIADNAARLAALFHAIDGGVGPICFAHFEAASMIAAWHLMEASRFFGMLALPEGMADAVKLDEWLIHYCKSNQLDAVSTRDIMRLGPSKLRKKENLTAAIQELIEHRRVVLLQDGRKREIQINPLLLED